MIDITKTRRTNIERKFVDACIKEGITSDQDMILIAMSTLRRINKDVVAGYKAAHARKRNKKRKR